MELTPIKVPGKRRRDNGDADAVVVSPHKRLRGRLGSRRQKAREEKETPRLQSMPLEILEYIFYLSENINLPRSSPVIGRRLSGELIRRDFFIFAFEPVWERWLESHGDRFGDFYGLFFPSEGDPKLQSDLLELPWVDIDFILMCWDRFVAQFAKRRIATGQPFHVRHIRLWGDPDDVTKVNAKNDDLLVNPEKASDCFWHDYAAFRRIEELDVDNFEFFARSGSQDPESNDHTIQSPTLLYVHKAIQIPDSLLIQAASDERALQKLFWLARGGARFAHHQTWELTLQAFHHYVPKEIPYSGEINLTAVRIFDLLGAFANWPDHIMREEIGRLDHDANLPITVLTANGLKSCYIAWRLALFQKRGPIDDYDVNLAVDL
ncbi:hypothetical protein F5Y13DRAFT_173345 [Hypoxylon sp. FL1857]|nr:hypothetical protein F5Y13DRAFT_173345 [Hypoxylon sp. FL1857]